MNLALTMVGTIQNRDCTLRWCNRYAPEIYFIPTKGTGIGTCLNLSAGDFEKIAIYETVGQGAS